MERLFRSLKTARLNYQSFANHYEVVQNVESYIYFYNYKRIHSAIGYMTPAQKMAELEKVAWNVSKINGPLQYAKHTQSVIGFSVTGSLNDFEVISEV